MSQFSSNFVHYCKAKPLTGAKTGRKLQISLSRLGQIQRFLKLGNYYCIDPSSEVRGGSRFKPLHFEEHPLQMINL